MWHWYAKRREIKVGAGIWVWKHQRERKKITLAWTHYADGWRKQGETDDENRSEMYPGKTNTEN